MMTQDTWLFINSFAPWLSAIGTIAAVFVALYLARRDKTIRLKVSAGHRLIITPGRSGPDPEYIAIKIVNIGHRDAQVTGIGWKTGLFEKRYFKQLINSNEFSSILPIRLHDGEKANYYISLNKETNWLENFSEKMISPPFQRLQVHFIKLQVFTSVGKTIETTIETNLKKKLIEVINRNEHLAKN